MKIFRKWIRRNLVAVLVTGSTVGLCDEKLTIADNDRSDYEIVIKLDAPKTTKFAAQELKQYFKKVTGVDLPVREQLSPGKKAIYVGDNPALPKQAEFNPTNYAREEKFLIRELNGNIVIMGADCNVDPASVSIGNFGLLFGVYEFIERFLGVRWYAPGEFGECYKKLNIVKVSGLPVEQKPVYWKRSYWPQIFNESTVEDSLAWGRRMRGYGNKVYAPSHCMKDFGEIFQDHTEIFALNVDGSRHFGKKYPYPQFCFSNPDTLKAYLELIDAYYKGEPMGKKWKRRHPTKDFIYVVPSDDFNLKQCFCPKCQAATDKSRGIKGMQSNLVWGFIAKVAKAVQKKYPDKRVAALAYQGYLLPPDKVDLPSSILTEICLNPYIIYSGFSGYEKQNEDLLKKWGKRLDEISVWQYYMPYADFPYMMPHKLYKWYTSHPKVKSCFIELMDTVNRRPNLPLNPKHKGKTVATDLAQAYLNLYFSMKAMWGTQCDVDKELELYYDLFFGPAAEPMKKFHQLAMSRWEKVEGVEAKKSPRPDFSGKELYEKIYSPEVVAKLSALMAQACKMTSPGSIYRKRLEWIKDSYFNAFIKTAKAFEAQSKLSKDLVIIPAQKGTVVDGNINKEFWKNKKKLTFLRNDAPLAPRFPTTFKMAMDKDNLYLAIKADDPDSANQFLNSTTPDSQVYVDDSYEIYICPDADEPGEYYQTCVNLKDVVFDHKVSNHTKSDVGWSSGIKSKTIRHDGYWTSELALPLKNMKIDINKNSVWRFNLCRNKKSGVGENHEKSQYATTYGSFGNTKAMPKLHVISTKSGFFQNFENPSKARIYPSFRIYTKKTPKGNNVKKYNSIKIVNGTLLWQIDFPEPELMYKNYAILTFGKAGKADIKDSPVFEIRFKKPDANISLTVAYSFVGVDGKTYSDFFFLTRNESLPEWQTRSFNIQDGYNAKKKLESGATGFAKPETLRFISLYAKSAAMTENKSEIEVSYIRFK